MPTWFKKFEALWNQYLIGGYENPWNLLTNVSIHATDFSSRFTYYSLYVYNCFFEQRSKVDIPVGINRVLWAFSLYSAKQIGM